MLDREVCLLPFDGLIRDVRKLDAALGAGSRIQVLRFSFRHLLDLSGARKRAQTSRHFSSELDATQMLQFLSKSEMQAICFRRMDGKFTRVSQVDLTWATPFGKPPGPQCSPCHLPTHLPYYVYCMCVSGTLRQPLLGAWAAAPSCALSAAVQPTQKGRWGPVLVPQAAQPRRDQGPGPRQLGHVTPLEVTDLRWPTPRGLVRVSECLTALDSSVS